MFGKSKLGMPLGFTTFDKALATLIKKANVKEISSHGLRHTMAPTALERGESILSVSKRLGHKKTSLTLDVYAHALPDSEASAATTMDKVLFG